MASYLQADKIARRIGDRVLFENVDFNINEDEKVALIAVNGAGKSSMLDILAGVEQPDEGSLSLKRDLKIAYLRQAPTLDDSKSIIDEVLSSGGELAATIREYEKAMHEGNEARLPALIQKIDDLKAWDYEVRVRQILFKLALTDLEAKIANLSGGQQKRVALAKVLVEDYDLLILDEPTNHLDYDMIEWLEEYLLKEKTTIIMVTHDRYFLDRICTVILEISDKELLRYEGNYEYYLTRKEEKIIAERSSGDRARNLFRKELEWMRRMPKARRHKAKSRIDSFYDLRQKAAVRHGDKTVNIAVSASRLGKKIAELKNISKAYDGVEYLKNFSYSFSRFEKVGLVGPNGSGKTTLLNIIAGTVQPDDGLVERGETLNIGYYRQEGISFDEDMTVLEAASSIAEQVTLSEGNTLSVSQFLTHFLFPPDRQYTLVRKLSGGEKRRLYLLTTLMRNPNFLILDEPANDLDLLTLNVLEDYLLSFRGCVIIVSHDRFLMDKVVDHILEFGREEGIRDFAGNYSQLRDFNEDEALRLKEEKENRERQLRPSEDTKPQREKRNALTYKEKKEMEALAAEISAAEAEKASIELELASGSSDYAWISSKSSRHAELMALLDDREMKWLVLSEKESNS